MHTNQEVDKLLIMLLFHHRSSVTVSFSEQTILLSNYYVTLSFSQATRSLVYLFTRLLQQYL
ncbi:MAG: hypothetical protein ACFN1E_07820 [Prevotella melaninogenica]